MNIFNRNQRVSDNEAHAIINKIPSLKHMFPEGSPNFYTTGFKPEQEKSNFLYVSRFNKDQSLIDEDTNHNHHVTRENTRDQKFDEKKEEKEIQIAKSKHIEKKRQFAMALASLASKPNKRFTIVKYGAVSALNHLATLEDPIIETSCAVAFANLSLEPSIRSQMIEEGSIITLVNLLSSETNHYDIRSLKMDCCKAICNLCTENNFESRAVKEGAAFAVTHSASVSKIPEIIDICLMILLNLSCVGDKYPRIEEVSEALIQFSSMSLSPAQEELLLSAFYNLSALKSNQFRLVEDGCLIVVEKALKSNVRKLKTLASDILRNLTTCQKTRSKLLEHNVIPMIMSMSDDEIEDLKSSAIKSLYQLSNDDACRQKIVSGEAVHKILSICSKNFSNPTTGRIVAKTLRTLCGDVAIAKKLLSGEPYSFKSAPTSATTTPSITMTSFSTTTSTSPTTAMFASVIGNSPHLFSPPSNGSSSGVPMSLISLNVSNPNSFPYLQPYPSPSHPTNHNGHVHPPLNYLTKSLMDALMNLLKNDNIDITQYCVESVCSLFQMDSDDMGRLIEQGSAIKVVVSITQNKMGHNTADWCALALYYAASSPFISVRNLEKGILPCLMKLCGTSTETAKKLCAAAFVHVTLNQNVDSSGSIPILVQMLRTENERSIRTNCATSLYNLARIDENCHLMMEEGALMPVVKLAQSDYLRTKMMCAAILSRLSLHKQYYDQFAMDDVLKVLLDLSCVDHILTQRRVVIALSNLSQNEGLRNQLHKLNPIPFIISLAAKRDENLWRGCVSIVCNLSYEIGSETSIVKGGIVPTLLITALINTDSTLSKIICVKALMNLMNDESLYPTMVNEKLIWGLSSLALHGQKKQKNIKTYSSLSTVLTPQKPKNSHLSHHLQNSMNKSPQKSPFPSSTSSTSFEDVEYEEEFDEERHEMEAIFDTSSVGRGGGMIGGMGGGGMIGGMGGGGGSVGSRSGDTRVIDNSNTESLSPENEDEPRLVSQLISLCATALCRLSCGFARKMLDSEATLKTVMKLVNENDVHLLRAGGRILTNILLVTTKNDEKFRKRSVENLKKMASTKDEEVIELCMLCLCLASQSESSRTAIVKSKMLQLMDGTTIFTVPRVSYAYLTMFGNIANNSDMSSELLDDHSISRFMQICMLNDRILNLAVAKAIYCITCANANIPRLAQQNVLPIIQRICETEGKNNSQLLHCLCATLYNMCIHPEVQNQLVLQGIIELFISLWEDAKEEQKLCRLVILAVCHLACGSVNSTKMVEARCTEILTFTTACENQKKYSHYKFHVVDATGETMYLRCSAALRNLGLIVSNQLIMIEQGCIESLVSMYKKSHLHQSQQNVTICRNCVAALRSMTFNEEIRQRLLASEAISVILLEINRDMSDEENRFNNSLLEELEAESWINGSRGHRREGRAALIHPGSPYLDLLKITMNVNLDEYRIDIRGENLTKYHVQIQLDEPKSDANEVTSAVLELSSSSLPSFVDPDNGQPFTKPCNKVNVEVKPWLRASQSQLSLLQNMNNSNSNESKNQSPPVKLRTSSLDFDESEAEDILQQQFKQMQENQKYGSPINRRDRKDEYELKSRNSLLLPLEKKGSSVGGGIGGTGGGGGERGGKLPSTPVIDGLGNGSSKTKKKLREKIGLSANSPSDFPSTDLDKKLTSNLSPSSSFDLNDDANNNNNNISAVNHEPSPFRRSGNSFINTLPHLETNSLKQPLPQTTTTATLTSLPSNYNLKNELLNLNNQKFPANNNTIPSIQQNPTILKNIGNTLNSNNNIENLLLHSFSSPSSSFKSKKNPFIKKVPSTGKLSEEKKIDNLLTLIKMNRSEATSTSIDDVVTYFQNMGKY